MGLRLCFSLLGVIFCFVLLKFFPSLLLWGYTDFFYSFNGNLNNYIIIINILGFILNCILSFFGSYNTFTLYSHSYIFYCCLLFSFYVYYYLASYILFFELFVCSYISYFCRKLFLFCFSFLMLSIEW